MDKICVLIRVYNRVEDLKYAIEIIRDTWKSHEYFIIVVFNGEEDGYRIDKDIIEKIDLLLKIKNNIGHFSGNSQLLLEGLPHIPQDCEYTIILEADTWLYGDQIINKYVHILKEKDAVWASAQFFRYVLNLATDFAIIKTGFIKKHPDIFKFSATPEYYVANYLKKNKFGFVYIPENMPVNLPRYFRKYPYASKGRFFIFEKSKMVTHHIENLPGGMDEKKFYFNQVSGSDYFQTVIKNRYKFAPLKMRFFIALSAFLPYKSWFIKKTDK